MPASTITRGQKLIRQARISPITIRQTPTSPASIRIITMFPVTASAFSAAPAANPASASGIRAAT